MNVSKLSRKHGINVHSLHCRLKRGWDVKKAIETPVAKKGRPAILPIPKHDGPLRPLLFGETYRFRVRHAFRYKLERIVKCAAGPLALFRIGGCKALESFTRSQLLDEGYEMPSGPYGGIG